MCVGLIEVGKLIPAKASGAGNPVLLVGAATGRDGIHGATFASVELDEASEERRPAVQVGDPFTEKLLMEACLELRDTGWIVGMQDLGAAGLTSSSIEMRPQRAVGHRSRRRAGAAPRVGHDALRDDALGVAGAHAGHRPQGPRRRRARAVRPLGAALGRGGRRHRRPGDPRARGSRYVVAEVETRLLTDEVPTYIRDGEEPPELAELWRFDPASLADCAATVSDALLTLLGSHDLCSREDVYRTYDTMVGANTVLGPGSDAAVLRVRDAADRETGKYLALATDGNGRSDLARSLQRRRARRGRGGAQHRL